MKKSTKSTKKSTKAKATKAVKAKPTKVALSKPASWLVGRLRNALHKTKPSLKEGQTLHQVSTLSDVKAAMQMPTSEWENLLESFFNLGGKLA